MNILVMTNSIILAFSLFVIILIFLLNPLMIWIVYVIKGKKIVRHVPIQPSVSFIIVVRNAETIIEDKIRNAISLDYPSENYEIIVFSDGSTDGTEDRIKAFVGDHVRFLSSPTHKGKNNGINEAVQCSRGQIMIFSDADVMLDRHAVMNLVKYFSDPSVGGVCGLKIICKTRKELESAQIFHTKFEEKIKKLECLTGSISSNDGTLFAIRRSLFMQIPPAVTDDLYVCLSVVKQHYRFLFEPEAKAFMEAPSRNTVHEVKRRQRIISNSLNGIFMMKELLNPFKYGIFSIRLFINRVMRRFVPVYLILIFFSSLFLSFSVPQIEAFLFLQIAFYCFAFSYTVLFRRISCFRVLRKMTSSAYYFCIGNYGTLLGLFCFFTGKQVTKW